jgi:hypothetical protein
MENYTHCPKCDVQLIYKPSIEICPNCGWSPEDEAEFEDASTEHDSDYDRGGCGCDLGMDPYTECPTCS